MQLTSLYNALKGLNIPVAYGYYPEEHAFPYIVYQVTDSGNFAGDNYAYAKINEVQVDLYTEAKNPSLQNSLQTVLDGLDLFYNKREDYVSSENCFAVSYTFEIMEEQETNGE